eukprot:313087-Karenia_brevis.AAC.1
MSTQMSFIDTIVADIFALQEVRLSEVGQRDMARELKERGWQCFWGRHQEPQERADPSFVPSPWNAAHGGVGILVRNGIPARHAPVDTPTR